MPCKGIALPTELTAQDYTLFGAHLVGGAYSNHVKVWVNLFFYRFLKNLLKSQKVDAKQALVIVFWSCRQNLPIILMSCYTRANFSFNVWKPIFMCATLIRLCTCIGLLFISLSSFAAIEVHEFDNDVDRKRYQTFIDGMR